MIQAHMARFIRQALICWLCVFTCVATATTPAQKTVLERLAADLQDDLDEPARPHVHRTPVLLESIRRPVVYMASQTRGSETRQAVHISAGMVDLLQYLARAKAIGSVAPGYFDQAVLALAGRAADQGVPELPPSRSAGPKGEVANLQSGYFEQMAGGLIGVELAHYSLGHYPKEKLQPGEIPPPLNSRISAEQWKTAMSRGAKSAFHCGLAPDGLKLLYGAARRLQPQPAWVLYLLPAGVSLDEIIKELDRVEADMFPEK
jgi:hypothetical protein